MATHASECGVLHMLLNVTRVPQSPLVTAEVAVKWESPENCERNLELVKSGDGGRLWE